MQPLAYTGAQTPADGVVTLQLVASWCEREEKTLRNQYPKGELPSAWESGLARFKPDTLVGALRRWAYLKHLFFCRNERLQVVNAADAKAESEKAARQLLRREPVELELGRFRLKITARSYNALAELAAHANRVKLLEADVEWLHEAMAADLELLAAGARGGARSRIRRRYRRRAALVEALLLEAQLHRRAIYAHALTAEGQPAKSLDDLPPGLEELPDRADVTWDAAIMAALHEVGPGRLARLVELERAGDAGRTPPEADAYGFASFWAQLGGSMVDPAPLLNADLYQRLAREKVKPKPQIPENDAQLEDLL